MQKQSLSRIKLFAELRIVQDCFINRNVSYKLAHFYINKSYFCKAQNGRKSMQKMRVFFNNLIFFLQYVLNVTPDLPNVFENVGNIKYMQIPITDHWSQNLASHFPKAIEFIGKQSSLLASLTYNVTVASKSFYASNRTKEIVTF